MSAIRGKRVFLVEDEAGVALLIEDMVLDLGCEIAGSAANLDQACRTAETVACDFALLDVNLNGRPVFPAATILRERQIPIIFSTGYGASGIPEDFNSCPVLGKPFLIEDLQQKIELALRPLS